MGPLSTSAASAGFLPKVLLFANNLASAHAVREGIRRAGLTLILETVSSRSEYLSRLRSGPVDLVLAAVSDFGGLSIGEIKELAERLGVQTPFIVIEANPESSPKAARSAVVLDHIDANDLSRLPTIIERFLRERREGNKHDTGRFELERAAEHLRENQKLLTLGRLTASIVHEINNPLESLSNLLYLLEIDQDSGEKRAEYLKLAQKELSRVVQISRQTLSFSRETSAPIHLQVAELLEEVLELYGRRIAGKNIRVIRQYESAEDVIAFPGEMRQILSNLLANAIEANAVDGMLTVRIHNARKWSDEGVRGLNITVADNGSGMSSEVQRRLGEPFFTTKGQAGTGLGLWVTRSILSRYGGSLRVRSSISQDRHGTVFTIFIPTNMRPFAVAEGGSGCSTASSRFKSRTPNYRASHPELTQMADDELIAG